MEAVAALLDLACRGGAASLTPLAGRGLICPPHGVASDEKEGDDELDQADDRNSTEA